MLNAKLIPIIEDLLYSVKMVLREKGIRAPIMVVKGDGTLMTEEVAKEKPVETVLSGPAASVIGALALTGRKDGVVVDMGGTTTDIASVSEGAVKIKKEGAKVGGWFTRVQAAEISTFGLGGDSRLCLDKKGRLKIGPEKVWPLCVMGSRYPNLIHELKSFRRTGEFKAYSQQEADCFMTGGKTLPKTASDLEAKILDQLKDGPHSLTFLAKAVGKAPETIDLTSLVEAGVLTRIAVTPTDLLHVKGTYTRWDRDISYKGVQILANRMELSVSDFLEMAEKAILSKMALCFIQSAADFDGESFDFRESPEAMYLIEAAFKNRSLSLLRPKLGLGKPLVAIGAPAGAWARDAGKLLGAEVIVPENADVANAYGAAAGQVIEKAELLISADGNGFILNTPWKRYVYSSREEAMFYAIHEGRRHIEHILMDAGCRSWKIEEASSDIMAPAKEDEPRVYMGTKLIITGTGTVL